MSGVALRPYQSEAIARVRSAVANGSQRPLLVAPTGSGKTICSTAVLLGAIAKGKRVLFVAHRRELIQQPFVKLIRAGVPHDQVGVIIAGVQSTPPGSLGSGPETADDDTLWKLLARRRPPAPVQIASIDTIRARGARPQADIIIIDEAHRALAKSYTDLVDSYPDAVVLGMTATPVRSDGRGLGDMFDSMTVVATYAELVELGFLVAPRVFTVPSSALPDLGSVKLKGNDYDPEQLARAVDHSGLVGDIADHYLRHGNNAPAFAFGVNVSHSKHIAEQLCARGVPALHVDGNTETGEREAALRKLRSGEIKVLCNVDCFTEGTDVPAVKTVILARPTKSLRVYMQQVGRGSRPHGDVPFVILDHAGCAVEHGLPQDDREFTLDARPKRKRGATEPAAKTCEGCFAVVPVATRICPECGFEWPVAEREAPVEEAGELVEIAPATTEEKRAFWDSLCAARGHRKPGWVFHQYVERFGVRPPSSWRVPEHEHEREPADDNAQGAAWRRYVAEARERGYKPSAPRFKFRARFGRFPSEAQIAAWESVGAPPANDVPPPRRPRVVAPVSFEELERWAI